MIKFIGDLQTENKVAIDAVIVDKKIPNVEELLPVLENNILELLDGRQNREIKI